MLKRILAYASSEHPLWMCGFRPFFLLTALSAVFLLGLWAAFLAYGLPPPPVAGGPLVWHAHELLFGYVLAALAGFALTAIPEFTRSVPVPARTVRLLVGLWLLGRAGFWLSGGLGAPALALAGLAHLGLVGLLIRLFTPRLFGDPQRRHLSFLWVLVALAVLIVGFYTEALMGGDPLRWLHAGIGLMMILIVVAMSRISMRIVNSALEAQNDAAQARGEYSADSACRVYDVYRARPPKRNLAIACIAFYTAAEFFAPGARIGGWLALAAAAALFHLQSDWHVGRALFRRWPLMLFCVYLLMATGYGVMGIALLGGDVTLSAGRHLLTVGAMGLNIYLVLLIAGRTHAGHELDERPWVLGAALIITAALLRALGGMGSMGGLGGLGIVLAAVAPTTLYACAGIFWLSAYALYLWHMAPLLTGPRSDGGRGCEGVLAPAPPTLTTAPATPASPATPPAANG